jgi:hypothetical protein
MNDCFFSFALKKYIFKLYMIYLHKFIELSASARRERNPCAEVLDFVFLVAEHAGNLVGRPLHEVDNVVPLALIGFKLCKPV